MRQSSILSKATMNAGGDKNNPLLLDVDDNESVQSRTTENRHGNSAENNSNDAFNTAITTTNVEENERGCGHQPSQARRHNGQQRMEDQLTTCYPSTLENNDAESFIQGLTLEIENESMKEKIDEMKQDRAGELQRCKETSCSSSQDEVANLQASRIEQLERDVQLLTQQKEDFRLVAEKADDCSRKLGSSLEAFVNQSNYLVIELKRGHEQNQEDWKSELDRVKEECRKEIVSALLRLQLKHGMFVRDAHERLELVSHEKEALALELEMAASSARPAALHEALWQNESHKAEIEACRIYHQNRQEEWQCELEEAKRSHRTDHGEWNKKTKQAAMAHKKELEALSSELAENNSIVAKQLDRTKKELKRKLYQEQVQQRAKKQCLGGVRTTDISAVDEAESDQIRDSCDTESKGGEHTDESSSSPSCCSTDTCNAQFEIIGQHHNILPVKIP
jgi:hypothetical protein